MSLKHQWSLAILVIVCVILLSLFTVFMQVKALGLTYLRSWQLERHNAVLQGTAYGHWQYRVLSAYLVETVMIICKTFHVPSPVVTAFIGFRVVQNILLFWLAFLYYRKLGLPFMHTLVGLSLLAWGMSHAFYNSDLQFSTYTDVMLYLLAGIVILDNRYLWVLPITILAALNRGTSGLIPAMAGISGYLTYTFSYRSPASLNEGEKKRQSHALMPGKADHMRHMVASAISMAKTGGQQAREVLVITVVAFGLYGGILWGLRYVLGPRPAFYPHGVRFGIDLFVFNMTQMATWVQLFATLGLLPVLAICSMRYWPVRLYGFFWAVVPGWFLIHPFFSVMAESRNFLVPHALIFVPGSLFGLLIPSLAKRPA